MLNSIQEKLIKLCKARGWSFKIREKDLSLEEVFADFGVMPGLVKKASRFMSLCHGREIGASYPEDEKTTLGYKVQIDDGQDELELILFILQALVPFVNMVEVSARHALDSLTYE